MSRLPPLLLALFTCARPAAPQAGRTRAIPADTTTGTRATAAVSPGWSTARPGLRWQHVALDDDSHVLDWIVVRFDLATLTPRAERAPGDHLAGLASDPGVLFAVDAGFFMDDMRPAGTLISRGVSLGGPDARGGSGLLVVRRGRAELLDATVPFAAEPTVDLAVQCGPRLIERDGTVGIHRDDGRRFARTAACLRDGGRTLDVIVAYWRDDPMHGPGLLGLAQRLAAASPVGDPRGCESALNLDGGPSTGVYVRGWPAASHNALGPVPYALAVRAP